jgi:hypothetical protein
VALMTQASGGLGVRAAEAADGAVLDDLEELGLQRLGQERHLVEEDRPVMGGLEEAMLGAPGVGEGALLEAEKVGFQERLGVGRAVQLHESAGRGQDRLVEEAGDQALARSRLALDEDGGDPAAALVPPGEAAELGAHRLDGRALPQDLPGGIHRLLELQSGGAEAAEELADRFQAAVVGRRHDGAGQRVAVPALER